MQTMRVGRHSENDIVITDKTVSRWHAQLTRVESGHYYLEDLGSTNGTWVRNGVDWTRVETALLEHRGIIMLGEYSTTLLELLSTDAGAGPDQAPASPRLRSERGLLREALGQERDDSLDRIPSETPSARQPQSERKSATVALWMLAGMVITLTLGAGAWFAYTYLIAG